MCFEMGLYVLVFVVEISGFDFMVYFYCGGSKLNEIGVWFDFINGLFQDIFFIFQIFFLIRGDKIYFYLFESDVCIKFFYFIFFGWCIENCMFLNLIVNIYFLIFNI